MKEMYPHFAVDEEGDVRPLDDVFPTGEGGDMHELPPAERLPDFPIVMDQQVGSGVEAETNIEVEPEPESVDLGVRAAVLTECMDNLSRAAMLRGLLNSGNKTKIEYYGGEEAIKTIISGIEESVPRIMWSKLGNTDERDEYGYVTPAWVGYRRKVEDDYFGPGKTQLRNRREMKKAVKPYLPK